MLQMFAPETLANSESWLRLIAYYNHMKKMLPDTYIREAGHLIGLPVVHNQLEPELQIGQCLSIFTLPLGDPQYAAAVHPDTLATFESWFN